MGAKHAIRVALALSAAGALVGLAPGASANGRGAAQAKPSLISKAAAVRAAARWIGLPESARPAKVVRVVVKGDQTPFVHDLIEGRTCYEITFTGLTIRLPWGSGSEEITSAIHGLTALVDARSAQVLKVRSVERVNAPSDRRTVAEVEAELREMGGGERWIGLATTPPKMSLLRVLYDRESRWATYMEQLDAYYVTVMVPPSRRNEETGEMIGGPEKHDTWQVTLHSHVPFDPHQQVEQEKPRPIYGWRDVFDGQTGERTGSSSVY